MYSLVCLNRLIFKYNFDKVPNGEIGPQDLDELKLRIVALIKHEITQSNFIACPDQNVRFHVEPSMQLFLKCFFRYFLDLTASMLMR